LLTRITACVLFFSAVSPVSLATDTPPKPAVRHIQVASIAARPEDVTSLDGIIKAYYEVGSGPAGQARQWARDRTLYIPGVRFVLINDDGGKPSMQQVTHQQFVEGADPSAVKDGFFEHEIHRITHRYGNWAHIVSTSEARRTPDGPVTEHGLDNLELFWDSKRWWIVSVSITGERPADPLPKEFLP
jgi:hypothetical protein